MWNLVSHIPGETLAEGVSYGPKREEVAGECRRLHNLKLYDVYCSPNSGDKIKSNEMGRACGTYGRQEKCIQGFDWET